MWDYPVIGSAMNQNNVSSATVRINQINYPRRFVGLFESQWQSGGPVYDH